MSPPPVQPGPPEGIVYVPEDLATSASGLGLDLIVAFGSRAGGELPVGEDSDLDIAVLDREPITWKRYQAIHEGLSPVFRDYELDLVFLNDADPLFRFQVFRTAKRLYGDRFEFCRQQSYAYKGFVDSADLRRLEQTLFQKKLAYIDSRLNG